MRSSPLSPLDDEIGQKRAEKWQMQRLFHHGDTEDTEGEKQNAFQVSGFEFLASKPRSFVAAKLKATATAKSNHKVLRPKEGLWMTMGKEEIRDWGKRSYWLLATSCWRKAKAEEQVIGGWRWAMGEGGKEATGCWLLAASEGKSKGKGGKTSNWQ